MKEYVVVKEFTDKYNKEKHYTEGERLILNHERAAEMNWNKKRIIPVMKDKYSDLIISTEGGIFYPNPENVIPDKITFSSGKIGGFTIGSSNEDNTKEETLNLDKNDDEEKETNSGNEGEIQEQESSNNEDNTKEETLNPDKNDDEEKEDELDYDNKNGQKIQSKDEKCKKKEKKK